MKNLITTLGILILILLIAELLSFTNKDASEEDKIIRYEVRAWKIPEKMSFAGEDVPINDLDVLERFDRELLINTYWHSKTLLHLKRANRWFAAIEKILHENNVPEDFKYMAIAESGLDYHAISGKGAAGIWQFLEHTAREFGLEVNDEIDERCHIEKSTEAACKYFKKAYEKLGSWTLAAASYNAGMRAIKKQINNQKVNSYYDLYLNTETARFVFRIIAIKEVFNNPKKYGFHLGEEDLYYPYTTEFVQIDSSINDLTAFAIAHNTNYKMLKILNPWLQKPYLKNPGNKSYNIKLLVASPDNE